MGGFLCNQWEETLEFIGLIDHDSSLKTIIAEQQGIASTYTVFIGRHVMIHEFDVFKRIADGQIFRATSSPFEQTTPSNSRMDFKVFSAEKYILPDA